MAVELNTLPSNNINNIDTNFQRVEVALQDAVSRSGNGPNQFTADVDMNSKNLLNVFRIDVQEFYMDGQPIASIPGFEAIVAIASDIITVAAISDEVIAVAANSFNINTVGNNITNVNAVGTSIASVNTVASNITAINTSNANSANINTVATNISSVVTVASNIANVNSVTANIVNVNTVALNIASINTAATNIAAIIAAPAAASAAATSASNAAASEAAVAGAGVPTGTIIMRFGPLLPGYLAWGEGGTFNRATYPSLATWLDNNGASLGLSAPQIAAGTIPDWRDYSPRTAGGALGPAVGALQQDAFQGHWHDVYGYSNYALAAGGNTNGMADLPSPLRTMTYFEARAAKSDGTNGTPRTATETRVKSFGVRWQIKAAGAVADVGTVSIMALAASVTNLENKAIRGDVVQTLSVGEKRQARVNQGAIFTDEYASPDQTFVSGGALTIAHTLGVTPKELILTARCIVAEHGFVIGDLIFLPISSDNSVFMLPASWWADATNIYARFGTSSGAFIINHKTTGVRVAGSPTGWRFVVRAVA